MQELRRRLQQITDNGVPDTHPLLIESLRIDIPHSIEIVQAFVPNERYTCVMHSLDLIENKEYIEIATVAPRDIFASPRFVERLINSGHLQELMAPVEGALAVYFDGGAVKHIGRLITATSVESKWGVVLCIGTVCLKLQKAMALNAGSSLLLIVSSFWIYMSIMLVSTACSLRAMPNVTSNPKPTSLTLG